MRITWDDSKSQRLKRDRGISFEEAQELFSCPYVVQQKNDDPEQYKAIGFVRGKLITLIVEVRQDNDGEYEHFVTLWKSTKGEVKDYEENI